MKEMTLINFILDCSGSMADIADETVAMFNNFLYDQKNGPDYAELSLIQFNHEYHPAYLCKPIVECPALVVNESYNPKGFTALLDAIGETIDNVGKELARRPEYNRPKRVMVVILTDGMENNSSLYTLEIVKDMIKHQNERYQWDFIFLGAGIDAIKSAGMLGIKSNKAMSFSGDKKGIIDSMATTSNYTTSYRVTGDLHQNVVRQDGDAWVQSNRA